MKTIIVILIILLLLNIIFLFFILPGNDKKCFNYDWLFKSLIAHRGYFDNEKGIIENSKQAFEKAIEFGFNIETDIILTKDDKLIVFHDENLKRLFKIDKNVSEMTLQEIKQLSYENSDDKVLEFSEFLSIISSKTGLLLELKSQNKQKDIILCKAVMEQLKNYKGNYVIQSFNPHILRYFKKNYPLVVRGQLYTKFDLKKEFKKMKGQGLKRILDIVSKALYNIKFTNFFGRPHFIDNECKHVDFFTKVCHFYMPVIVFTVCNINDYNHYKKSKIVNNIIFENLEIDKNGRAKKRVS